MTTPLPIIRASQTKMYLLFKNLIENGIKDNQSIVPKVEIELIQDTDQVKIKIHDNGIGIVKKYQQKSAPKVFVQGPFGNWSWRSRNADVSIEEVTRLAIDSCQNGWLYQKFDSACEVVNVNGKWVK